MSALEQLSAAPAVTEQAVQVTALAQGSVPRQVENPGGQRESLQSVLLLDCAVPASSPLKGSGGLIGPTGWVIVA